MKQSGDPNSGWLLAFVLCQIGSVYAKSVVPDGCGIQSETTTRIVGGDVSFPGRWPWMAALFRFDSQYCAGVLISNQHVLTAAHCIQGLDPKTLRVRLGQKDIPGRPDTVPMKVDVTPVDASDFFGIDRILIHQNYDPVSHLNDIAVLHLNRIVEFSLGVLRICLPPPTVGTFEDKEAIVAGWGTVAFMGSPSATLREVPVPVWSNSDCLDALGKNIFNTSLCAGGKEKIADACQGDSGGPLMMRMADERWAVIGIVSWGIKCGEPSKPGVYTRTSRYVDWILPAVRSTFN